MAVHWKKKNWVKKLISSENHALVKAVGLTRVHLVLDQYFLSINLLYKPWNIVDSVYCEGCQIAVSA